MNLLMAPKERNLKIVKVREKRSSDRQDKLLSDLGFVTGAKISVVADNGGNLIVNIKDSRVALGKDLAIRILVEELN